MQAIIPQCTYTLSNHWCSVPNRTLGGIWQNYTAFLLCHILKFRNELKLVVHSWPCTDSNQDKFQQNQILREYQSLWLIWALYVESLLRGIRSSLKDCTHYPISLISPAPDQYAPSHCYSANRAVSGFGCLPTLPPATPASWVEHIYSWELC